MFTNSPIKLYKLYPYLMMSAASYRMCNNFWKSFVNFMDLQIMCNVQCVQSITILSNTFFGDSKLLLIRLFSQCLQSPFLLKLYRVPWSDDNQLQGTLFPKDLQKTPTLIKSYQFMRENNKMNLFFSKSNF